MSMSDLPPCGWNASTGLQYYQAVTFTPSPSGCVVTPLCCPPQQTCVCPMPGVGGFWLSGPPCPKPPKPASFKPPQFRASPGVNFIPPKNITTLFIFTEEGAPTEGSLKFQPWQIDSSKTVQDVLEHLEKGDENWSVVEYFEEGDGNWKKGITVGYADDRATKAISTFGWTPKRGGSLPPVWLATEKKES